MIEITPEVRRKVVELLEANQSDLQVVRYLVDTTSLDFSEAMTYIDSLNIEDKPNKVTPKLKNEAIEIIIEGYTLKAIMLIKDNTTLSLADAMGYIGNLKNEINVD